MPKRREEKKILEAAAAAAAEGRMQKDSWLFNEQYCKCLIAIQWRFALSLSLFSFFLQNNERTKAHCKMNQRITFPK